MTPRPKVLTVEEINKEGRIYLIQNKPGLGGNTKLKQVTDTNLKTYFDKAGLTDSTTFQQHAGWIAARSKYNSVTAIFVPADSVIEETALLKSLQSTILIGRKVSIAA